MKSVYQIFQQMVKRYKDETAFIYEAEGQTESITYGGLQRDVDALSERICEKSGEKGKVIGVCMKRSPRTIAAMLAIWKTGNIYVPIDRNLPKLYIRQFIGDAGISAVISEKDSVKKLPKGTYHIYLWEEKDGFPEERRTECRNQDHSSTHDISFIIYTSGTTGMPKGAKHTQYVIMNQLLWYWKKYPYDPGEVVALRTSVGYMPFMCEAVEGLLKGIKTVIIGEKAAKDIYRIMELIEMHQITRIRLVPSQLDKLLKVQSGIQKLSSLKLVALCGEKAAPELYARFHKLLPKVSLINDYGSAETGMMLAAENGSSEFFPISNIKAMVLNDRLEKCGIREEGMLYIEGKSIMRGYTKEKEQKNSFVVHSGIKKHILYQTGDLAVYTKNGGICILGRKDRQLKIRGMRMNPESVEAVLCTFDEIKECCVIGCGDPGHETRLAACIVCRKGSEISGQQIKERLYRALPDYMIPDQYIRLKKLPKTQSGKINRKELEKTAFSRLFQTDRKMKKGERMTVAEVVAKQLGIEEFKVGRNQTFRDLGLNSLSMVDLAESLNEIYGKRLTVTDLLNYPTAAELQTYLEEKHCVSEKEKKAADSAQVAIVGMAARFAGACNTEELWELLKEGKSSIGALPREREAHFGKYKDIKGGFLAEIDLFDADFFGISPSESAQMDPLQRMCLEECFHALEDAGCTEAELNGSKAGIFAGAREGDYKDKQREQGRKTDASAVTGCDSAVISARLCYLFNMKGAAITVNTACSSSLSALHLACRSIQSRDCELAVAFGGSVMNTKELFLESEQLGILSERGELRAFDEAADGTVLGEGVSVVVLKSLADALRDRNQIYGIIAGSGMNQDGRTNGITAPNGLAQVSLMKEVYEKEIIDPGSVSYIECHSTGTVLGDPVEAASVRDVFGGCKENIYLGSIKPNIGHTVAASGIAGVIKVLLSMKHEMIPPAVNFERINHRIDFTGTKLAVNRQPVPWRGTKTAAVNSFGFSGTNVHVVLRSYEGRKKNTKQENRQYLIPISAKTEKALREKEKQLLTWLSQEGCRVNFADIAYTLQYGRDHYTYRKAYVAGNAEELIQALLGSGQTTAIKTDLIPLLKAYEKGEQVEFGEQGTGDGTIISLPAYPFSRVRISEVLTQNETGIFVKPVWEETKANQSGSGLKPETAVFACQDNILMAFRDCIRVKLSGRFQKKEETVFETGQKQQDYERLLNSLFEKREKKLRLIYIQQQGPEPPIHFLLPLVKALMEVLHGEDFIEFIYAYPGKHSLAYPGFAAVSAFFQTLQLENKHFRCKAVEIADMEALELWPEMLRKEAAFSIPSVPVRYEGSSRYERHLHAVMPERKAVIGAGVYVITGGMGGIGSILAQHLLKGEGRSVILLGRSVLEGAKKERFERIKSEYPPLFYYHADVTDQSKLTEVFEQIRAAHGAIRGVLHCAGIIRDRLFMNKSAEDFAGVVRVKADGVLNLHQVTAGDRLDFFAAFSSVTSVFGNYGQTDYGYGNGFMDSFMCVRNDMVEKGICHGTSLSIQWPLWAHGGMNVSPKELEQMKIKKGMLPIKDADGMELLEQAMGTGCDTVAVFYGEKAAMIPYLKKQGVCFSGKPDARTAFLSYVTEIVSSYTGIPAEQITPEKQFDEFGMDSFTIINMTEAMEQKLGRLSKTLFYEYHSIEELVGGLIKRYEERVLKNFGETKADEKEVRRTVRNEGKIAIIGMHGRFPEAPNLEVFWDNLWAGRNSVTEIPKSRLNRWRTAGYEWDKNDEVYVKWAGLLPDPDRFDPLFFHISPREAELMDPQERIFLETVWELLSVCGYGDDRLRGKDVGVFAGTMWDDYLLYGIHQKMGVKPSSNQASIANRVSYVFDFKGPSMSVNTMCSSSITALWTACESLRSGSCEYAIAGGVNLITHPGRLEWLCQGKFASPSGRCKSFGAGADGYVPGEGAGAVLLKPLEKAVEDGDYIYGVILDIRLNHGGRTSGYTVPSPASQAELIASSLKQAGISPLKIGYYEAHGTGTALGDPIEIEGIKKAFAGFTGQTQFCPIGSVKSNIGHLEAAAGMASLLKVLMQMYKKKLVPSLYAKTPNPNIPFEQTPVRLQQKPAEWEPAGPEHTRIAAVSSFGAGGSGGFMLVEEYKNGGKSPEHLLPKDPFDRQSYWIGESREFMRQDGHFVSEVYRSDMTDHQIGGRVIYPAAAIIKQLYDMASESGLKKEAIVIEELLLLSPVLLDQEKTIVAIDFHWKDETLKFEVFAEPQGNQPNAKGSIRLTHTGPCTVKGKGRELLKDCERRMESHEFYGQALKKGLSYGTDYRTVEAICQKGSRAAAYINARGFVQALDGVFQTCLALDDAEEAAVPYLIEGIRLYGPVLDRFQTYASRSGSGIQIQASGAGEDVFLTVDHFAVRQMKETKSFSITKEKLEEHLKEVVAETGKIEIGRIRTDVLFENYGLDSLMLMEMEEKLEEKTGRPADNVFFRCKTIDQCVAFFMQEPEKKEANRDQFHLSEGQTGIFNAVGMNPDSYAYNTSGAFALHESVDETLLDEALRYLIGKHEGLRTVFPDWRAGLGTIAELPHTILKKVFCGDEEKIPVLLKQYQNEPFDLKHGALYQIVLVAAENKKRVLLLKFHHIVFDGISSQLFIRALKNVYCLLSEGKELPPCETDTGYRIFQSQEKAYLSGRQAAEDEKYWLNELPYTAPALKPGKDCRMPDRSDCTDDTLCVEIDASLTKYVDTFCKKHSISLFTAYLAAYMKLLYQFGGMEDIRIGVPVSVRNEQVKHAVGNFINMVVIRERIHREMNLEELARKLKRAVSGALEHRRYPYQRLVKKVSERENKAVLQLFQAAFYMNHWSEEYGDGFFDSQLEEIHQHGEYDLVLEIIKKDQKILVRFKYKTSVLTAPTVRKMAETYQDILKGCKKSQPGFLTMFAEQARLKPLNTAVVFEGQMLTYQELYQYAQNAAGYLASLGIKKDDHIGILLPRSLELLICMVGIQATGAAYVPMDPDYPGHKLRNMAEQADLRYVIAESFVSFVEKKTTILLKDLQDALYRQPAAGKNADMQGGELAYIIFTSGSTGNPKGVMIRQEALGNLLSSVAEIMECSDKDYMLALTTVSFDISGLEFYLMLTVGGTVEILSKGVSSDGLALRKRLEQTPATLMQGTPATWRMLKEAGWQGNHNLTAICGGEALHRPLADWLAEHTKKAFNAYGPTETTIWSMMYELKEGDAVYLGRPIANTQIYVLDGQQKEVENGAYGELYIGGIGLAVGYLKNEVETEKRFVEVPHLPGLRLYKTGDIVRKTEYGQLEYVGRNDAQMKKNGFRIDPVEVEEALMSEPFLRQAAVILVENHGASQIMAFLISEEPVRKSNEEWRRALKKRIPYYMIPDFYYYIDEFPMTSNQKVDRKRLKELGQSRIKNEAGSKDEVREALRKLVSDKMKLPAAKISDTENLGSYGFDSVTFTWLASKVNALFGSSLSPSFFYTVSTIGEIAEHISDSRSSHQTFPTVSTIGEIAEHISPRTNKREEDNSSTDGIAVIGIGIRLPDALNQEEFWENLKNGKNSVTRDQDTGRWGAFLKDREAFDAEFFHISAREARLMDPQQRIMMEEVLHAIEDAGYQTDALSGKNVGVYIGATARDYLDLVLRQKNTEPHTITGITGAVIANRISYFYNFTGPSEVIDTACSSGLTAVCRAVEDLRQGVCEYAFAGGINILCSDFPYKALETSNMLSQDGRLKTFDAKADGYVRGEGAVVFFLRPLKDAKADRDMIYGVIKGVSINHCGKTASLTAPNARAQKQLIKKAWDNAGFPLHTAGYMECHGTGTALGDPIEIQGLTEAFAEDGETDGNNVCELGSVKQNIGHLEAAAGAAGMLKLLLCIFHKEKIGNHFLEILNPGIELLHTPLAISRNNQCWEKKPGESNPRRGGISAFGFGGSNAHVVLEEYTDEDHMELKKTGAAGYLMVFSAEYEDGIKIYLKRLCGFLMKYRCDWIHDPIRLAQTAYTLQTGRMAYRYRMAVLVSSLREFLELAQGYMDHGAATEAFLFPRKEEYGIQKSPETAQLRITGQRWVNGETVDWNQFYDTLPQCVSLPGYPFQRTKFWLVKNPAQENNQWHDKLTYFVPYWEETEQDGGQKNHELRELVIYDGKTAILKKLMEEEMKEEQACFLDAAEFSGEVVFIPDRIYYLPGAGMEEEAVITLMRVLTAYQDHLSDMELCILTGGTNLTECGADWVYPACRAFARTAEKEWPGLIVCSYHFELTSAEDIRQKIRSIRQRCGCPEHILINDSAWLVQKMKEMKVPESVQAAHSFRERGVYLIAGMGGIGRQLGTYLARTAQASVVYAGRRAEDEKIRHGIEEIRREGGEAAYIQTDITDFDAVKHFIKKAREMYGIVDGIIFSAMVLKDCRIAAMTEQDLSGVLAVKVRGISNIMRISREEGIASVILISSLNAYVSNPGQANYSAACAASDALARSLGKQYDIPVKILNFSYWGEHGAIAGSDQGKRLIKQGMYPISDKEGMEALEYSMKSEIPDLIICKGEPQALEQIGIVDKGKSAFLQMEAYLDKTENYARKKIMAYFQSLGIFTEEQREFSREEILSRSHAAVQYIPLLDAFLYSLKKAGLVRSVGFDTYEAVCTQPDGGYVSIGDAPQDAKPYLELLDRCFTCWPEVLRGNMHYAEALFPKGNKELVQKVYTGNAVMDYYNRKLGQEIRRDVLCMNHKNIRILEVGAGTGSASGAVLLELSTVHKNITYVYSDVSAGFLAFGRQKFQAQYPFMETRIFNVEQDLLEQGMEEASCDIVFASNALHAAKDPARAVERLYHLLRPNGRLYINELTEFKVFSTCTFGLTPEWWVSDGEVRIPHSPLLQIDMWKRIMQQAGFEQVSILKGENWMKKQSQHVILGVRPLQSARLCENRIEKATGQEVLQEAVLNWVKNEFAEVLMIPASKISAEDQVERLGVDSLITIEIHKKWSELFPDIPAALLFEYDTPQKAAAFLLRNYEKELREILRTAPDESEIPQKTVTGEDVLVKGHHSYEGNTVLGTSYISMLCGGKQREE